LPDVLCEKYRTYFSIYGKGLYVFPGQKRNYVHPGTVHRVLKLALEEVGCRKYIVLHSLRATFATHLLEAGVPINRIQYYLGHSNIKTTLGYTRLTQESAVDCLLIINTLMNEVIL